MENLPETFQKVTLRFRYEDSTEKEIVVRPGGKIARNQIPAIPEKDGFTAKWEGLENADLENLVFDMTFVAVYTPNRATIQSQQTRENGLPLLLLEGAFPEQAAVSISGSDEMPTLSEGEIWLESWEITATHSVSTMRFLLPETVDAELVKLMVCDTQGVWKTVESYVDGSYLVFAIDQEIAAIALIQVPQSNLNLFVIGGALTLVLAMILLSRRKKQKVAPDQTESTPS